MIRAVVDTNIIVSAFFWGGLPRLLLNAARDSKFRIVCTEELLNELKDVISRPKFAARLAQIGGTTDELVDSQYRALVEIVSPAAVGNVISADIDDDALLACAVGGGADYIVSGDHHLLDLGTYQDIRCVTLRQFLEENLNIQ